nr:retrovirus-related Pol polyprotein from transposon TNT 1-94 [Tanacetum cinerariifolium]
MADGWKAQEEEQEGDPVSATRFLTTNYLAFRFVNDKVATSGIKSSGSRVLWLTRIDQEEVFVVRFFWKEQEGYILFGLPGSLQQKFLVLRFFDIKEKQGIDRLNIEKLDGNIVQKHGCSKQVGFKQLGPGVETEVHEGAQGGRDAEVFQVSNNDTAVAQRRLEDKQPEKKTNTDCLVKEQEKEYQTGWKIKTGNVLDFFNQKSTQQCTKSGVAKHLGVAVIQQQNGLVKETNVTLLAKVHCFLIQSGLSKVLWAEDTTMSTYLVNKQWMLRPVKVNCIFLGYHKSIVGNKLWRLDDVTSKVVLYRNMCFNESGKYKKTFIGFGVVAVVEKIYAHESLTFNNTVACK